MSFSLDLSLARFVHENFSKSHSGSAHYVVAMCVICEPSITSKALHISCSFWFAPYLTCDGSLTVEDKLPSNFEPFVVVLVIACMVYVMVLPL